MRTGHVPDIDPPVACGGEEHVAGQTRDEGRVVDLEGRDREHAVARRVEDVVRDRRALRSAQREWRSVAIPEPQRMAIRAPLTPDEERGSGFELENEHLLDGAQLPAADRGISRA